MARALGLLQAFGRDTFPYPLAIASRLLFPLSALALH